MRYWTYLEIKNKVRRDLGIEQETFVTPEELLGYVNEAIDECESEIHTLYEDYFLTKSLISIVNGTKDYELPANIYAMKIRSMIFTDGNEVYTIKRFKNTMQMFEKLEYQDLVADDIFRYVLFNHQALTVSDLPVIQLVPTPRKSFTDGIALYYFRNANRMVDDTSVCDIPEFIHYVVQHAKARCYEKEGDPRAIGALSIADRFRQNMVNTLTQMTPDGDNEIEKDLSHYSDMAIDDQSFD